MQRVIELINYSGPHQISGETVQVSLPEVSHVVANTLVTVKGLKASGLYGDHTFRYNRMDLANIGERTVTATGPVANVNELLPLLNLTPMFSYSIGSDGESMRKQALLLVEDIVNESLQHIAAGTTTQILVKANPRSYMYLGSLRVKLIRV